jgi:hypothetical protein
LMGTIMTIGKKNGGSLLGLGQRIMENCNGRIYYFGS